MRSPDPMSNASRMGLDGFSSDLKESCSSRSPIAASHFSALAFTPSTLKTFWMRSICPSVSRTCSSRRAFNSGLPTSRAIPPVPDSNFRSA